MADIGERIIAIYDPRRQKQVFIQIDKSTERRQIAAVGAGQTFKFGDVTYFRYQRLEGDRWVMQEQEFPSIAALLNSFNSGV